MITDRDSDNTRQDLSISSGFSDISTYLCFYDDQLFERDAFNNKNDDQRQVL